MERGDSRSKNDIKPHLLDKWKKKELGEKLEYFEWGGAVEIISYNDNNGELWSPKNVIHSNTS